jgi:hypothetical protein
VSCSPRFSVIICTYNRPTLVRRAVTSVLAQSREDFEVLVVDDHSTPPAQEALADIKDPRLLCLRQPHNQGVAGSTNLGLASARGDYVCILNDDDLFLPDFLEKMAYHLETTGSHFAWCGIEDAAEERPERYERVCQATHQQAPGAVRELLTRVGLGYGFTIRRDLLLEVGGLDQQLRSSEDTELFLRLVQRPLVWHSLPECLVRVYRQQQRLTRPSDRRIQDLIYLLDKHRSFFVAHPQLREHFQLLLASLYVEQGRRAQGRQLLWALLQQNRRQLRVWALLLANELGLGAHLLAGYRTLRAWLSRRTSTSR